MNQAEKEQYLREYSILKNQGKPFFPYAVAKDSGMAVVVMVVIILIFVHMARTFFFGAYKYPRELNWVIGVVLLILTFVMSFTGYLLPFDQRSYWATIVGVNINGTGPLVGPYLSDFLRAGPDFGATTLSRFYAIHMLLIPGAIAALIGAHLYLVAKLGTTAPPWLKAEPDERLREERA